MLPVSKGIPVFFDKNKIDKKKQENEKENLKYCKSFFFKKHFFF